MEIRRLGLQDKEPIIALYESMITRLDDKLFFREIKSTAWDGILQDPNIIVVGLFENGKLLSLSSLVMRVTSYDLFDEVAKIRANLKAEIGFTFTSPLQEGKGLATLAIKHLKQLAKEKQIAIILVSIHPDNVASYRAMKKVFDLQLLGTIMLKDKYPRNIYFAPIDV